MEDEQSFRQWWADAQASFEDKTKKTLKQAKNRSLDEFLAELEQNLNPKDPKSGSKQARIKELATNMLNFVQLLGGIAAQGASMVFGPANLCFNALSFLMNIPTKISSFYDNIAALFEQILSCMKQFKIYQRIQDYGANIGLELKGDTHKILIALVDICAISISVLDGGKIHTFKTMSKLILFDNDSGIQEKLNRFKTLIEHQGRISNAVTLEHVLKAEHDASNNFAIVIAQLSESAENSRVELQKTQEIHDKLCDVGEGLQNVELGTRELVKAAQEQKSERKKREEFSSVCKKLSVSPESILQMEKAFDQIKNDCLSSTGSWLNELDIYKQWADLESETSSQLLLSGDNSTGKSSLAVSVFNSFKSRFENSISETMIVSLAFYRFGKKEKKSRDNEVKESLKSMAAQIARSNRVFQSKILSPLLESKDSSLLKKASIEELFRSLFTSSDAGDGPSIAFILLFDDIDELPPDDVRQLFNAVFGQDISRLRIIMTGTDETFERCRDASGKSIDPFPLISVHEHNEPEIQKYIEQELIAQGVLPNDNPGGLRIVEEIRENLPRVANGNFDNVKQMIEMVNNAMSSKLEDEVIQMISADTLKHKDILNKKVLQELGHSLSKQEIEQLNTILAFVIDGWELMSLRQLAAALFLQTKKPLLQNLNIKIDRKYQNVLRMEGGAGEDQIVKLKSDELGNFLRNSPRERPLKIDTEGDKQPRISMDIKLDHVSIGQAQRFFWDLSEKVMLDKKFVFAVANADTSSDLRITANKVDSNLLIIKSCFDILLDEPKVETQALSSYAIGYIMGHLYDIREQIEQIEMAEKTEIIYNLVDLLQSPGSLEKHLTVDFLSSGAWLHNGLYTVRQWLCNTKATQGLNRKVLRWLKQANTADQLYPFTEIAMMIARQWLSSRTFEALYPFYWVSVYNFRLEEMQTPVKKEPTKESASDREVSDDPAFEFFSDADLSKEASTASTRIASSAEWAVNTARMVKNSLFYERLGDTFASYGEIDYAIENYLKAKRLPDPSWQLSCNLAIAYAAKKETKSALGEIENAFTALRSNPERDDQETRDFVSYLIIAAGWHVDLKQTPEATTKFKEAIELDEHRYESHYRLFKLLNDTEQGLAAMKVLVDMDESPAPKHENLTKLSSMLLEYPYWMSGIDSLEEMLQVTKSHDVVQVVMLALQKALEFAIHGNMDSHAVHLYLGHGLALAHYSADESGECFEAALRHWEECYRIGIRLDDWRTQNSAINAAKYIFNHHFSQAQALSITQAETDNYKVHTAKMRNLAEEATHSEYKDQPLKVSLASFYALVGSHDEARELLADDVRQGVEFCSGENLTNYDVGYCMIASSLMHSGDNLNALTAWVLALLSRREQLNQTRDGSGEEGKVNGVADKESLDPAAPAPEAPPAEERPSGFRCDGHCKKILTYADSLWFCRTCDDINFCDECLEKLRNRKLARFVCSADHQMLLVPAPADELKATGKGRVRVGGELVDGKRKGGEIVAVDEWLNTIKERWGIPLSSKEEEQKEESEGEKDVTEGEKDVTEGEKDVTEGEKEVTEGGDKPNGVQSE